MGWFGWVYYSIFEPDEEGGSGELVDTEFKFDTIDDGMTACIYEGSLGDDHGWVHICLMVMYEVLDTVIHTISQEDTNRNRHHDREDEGEEVGGKIFWGEFFHN